MPFSPSVIPMDDSKGNLKVSKTISPAWQLWVWIQLNLKFDPNTNEVFRKEAFTPSDYAIDWERKSGSSEHVAHPSAAVTEFWEPGWIMYSQTEIRILSLSWQPGQFKVSFSRHRKGAPKCVSLEQACHIQKKSLKIHRERPLWASSHDSTRNSRINWQTSERFAVNSGMVASNCDLISSSKHQYRARIVRKKSPTKSESIGIRRS